MLKQKLQSNDKLGSRQATGLEGIKSLLNALQTLANNLGFRGSLEVSIHQTLGHELIKYVSAERSVLQRTAENHFGGNTLWEV
ncbi:hypothetical protein DPV78_010886 [Talaromyces pinophilus]|nr:hypothetical protein DPV78_010886 [Talaromyces pinophilus]